MLCLMLFAPPGKWKLESALERMGYWELIIGIGSYHLDYLEIVPSIFRNEILDTCSSSLRFYHVLMDYPILLSVFGKNMDFGEKSILFLQN